MGKIAVYKAIIQSPTLLNILFESKTEVSDLVKFIMEETHNLTEHTDTNPFEVEWVGGSGKTSIMQIYVKDLSISHSVIDFEFKLDIQRDETGITEHLTIRTTVEE